MKKFAFRFSVLMKLKEYEKEKAKEELDESVVYRIRCQEAVAELEEEIEELLNSLSDLSSAERLEIHLIMNMRNFIAVKRLNLANANEKVRLACEAEQQKREIFIEARKECRKLEMIEEKDLVKYKKEQMKYETKILDEISSRKRTI